MRKKYYIYLGGNHLDSTPWRDEFNLKAKEFTAEENFEIIGIDPMKRNIDETTENIVSRDTLIITDPRVSHIVLMSMASGALLGAGMAYENMIAIHFGKPVIVIGEPKKNKIYPRSGKKFENWYHPFVEYFSTAIVPDISSALEWIINDIRCPNKKINLEEKLRTSAGFNFSNDDIIPFI